MHSFCNGGVDFFATFLGCHRSVETLPDVSTVGTTMKARNFIICGSPLLDMLSQGQDLSTRRQDEFDMSSHLPLVL